MHAVSFGTLRLVSLVLAPLAFAGCEEPTEPQAAHPKVEGDFSFAPLFPTPTDSVTVTGVLEIGPNTQVTAVGFQVSRGNEVVQTIAATSGLPSTPTATFTALAAGTYNIVMQVDATGLSTREPADFQRARAVVVSDCGPGPTIPGDVPVPHVSSCNGTYSEEDQIWCDEEAQQYLATTPLPTIQNDKPYAADVGVVGGTPPLRYEWVDSGNMNAFGLTGIAIDADGHISGTFTALTGTAPSHASLRVVDACASGPRAIYIPIAVLMRCGKYGPSLVPPQIAPTAAVGRAFSTQLYWINGEEPITPTIESQTAIPPFTLVHKDDGHWYLEGTPSVEGNIEVTITVRDACDPQQEDTRTYTITVDAAVTNPSPKCETESDCNAYCAGQCEIPEYTYCERGGHTCYCGC